jgi:hypothetical protein
MTHQLQQGVRLSRGSVEPIDERIQDQAQDAESIGARDGMTVATSEVTPLDRALNSATGL